MGLINISDTTGNIYTRGNLNDHSAVYFLLHVHSIKTVSYKQSENNNIFLT